MMFAYLEILRPSVFLLGMLGVLVGALLAGVSSIEMIALGIFITFLVTGGGNVINDYFDYEIDKVNRPKRPIPSGRIGRSSALIYSIALFVAALSLSVMLNAYALVLVAFNIFLSILYSWKLKAKPLLGNLCPSWLAASTFVFGSLLVGHFDLAVLSLFLMAFSGNTAREIVKAVEDLKGDKKAGYKTLPVVIGVHFSNFVALSFLIIGILLSFIPYGLGIFGINYLYAIFIADLVFSAAGFMMMTNPTKSQKMMKIGMFLTIAAFLVGIYL